LFVITGMMHSLPSSGYHPCFLGSDGP